MLENFTLDQDGGIQLTSEGTIIWEPFPQSLADSLISFAITRGGYTNECKALFTFGLNKTEIQCGALEERNCKITNGGVQYKEGECKFKKPAPTKKK